MLADCLERQAAKTGPTTNKNVTTNRAVLTTSRRRRSSSNEEETLLMTPTDDTFVSKPTRDGESSSSSSSSLVTTVGSNKRMHGDAFSRLAAVSSTMTTGRGSLSGWTKCPLCPQNRMKRFAFGRGIASHLHAVHTPWDPGKVELKHRRCIQRRQENEARRSTLESKTVTPNDTTGSSYSNSKTDKSATTHTWDPSPDEVEAWGKRVVQLVSQLESEIIATTTDEDDFTTQDEGTVKRQKRNHASLSTHLVVVGPGYTRNGVKSETYKGSLDPFLKAASDGTIQELKRMVSEATGLDDTSAAVSAASKITVDSTKNGSAANHNYSRLMNLRDRNGSTAEHWAAGGGHLECLDYLLTLPRKSECSQLPSTIGTKKIRTRRDGKTAMHYAARNGQNHVIEYLMLHKGDTNDNGDDVVNAKSGDGTTPLHMACYGGHLSTVQLLMEQYGADGNAVNDWDCGVAHFCALSLKRDNDTPHIIRELCHYLKWKQGVSFHVPQKQGHSSLHKAAQRHNRHMITWLSQTKEEGGAGLTDQERLDAGQPDHGGNRPSDIWTSVSESSLTANTTGTTDPTSKENIEFGEWMRTTCGW
eukprot:scaffold6828_cov53-Attheya_sp.AAC.1